MSRALNKSSIRYFQIDCTFAFHESSGQSGGKKMPFFKNTLTFWQYFRCNIEAYN